MAESPLDGFRIKRVYDEPGPSDGYRVLADRLWPRGVARDRAAVDLWARDLAPSTELRRWYGHDPAKFDEFRARYEQELAGQGPSELAEELRHLAGSGTVTLLTATKDPATSHLPVLADHLSSRPA